MIVTQHTEVFIPLNTDSDGILCVFHHIKKSQSRQYRGRWHEKIEVAVLALL